jgi:prolyl 4-hydroxylase
MLTRAAAAGSVPAQRLLGVLYANGFGVEQSWEHAIAIVVDAARNGAATAMCEIAMLLFAADADDQDGAALIQLAAPKDACASAIAVRRTVCGRQHSDPHAAAQYLKNLQRIRYPNANALEAALLKAPHGEIAAQSPDWSRVTEKLAAAPSAIGPIREVLSASPSALVYRKAFTLEECEYIIASSARLLAPSTVSDPRTGNSLQDDYRTSLTAIMSIADLDLSLTQFNRRLAALARHPPENAEALGVLYYAPGKEYRPHYDWLPPGPEYDRGGQRLTTALLYLNDDYDGGETHFLTPDIRFRGEPGDVLVFNNALKDGSPDRTSRHAGLPVTAGVKWLGSTWYREKKYSR